MTHNLLCAVQRPGRYLGREVNLPRKDWTRCAVRMVLAFPDVYEVGMSHLGLMLLYQILNRKEWIGAERVFAPWLDMEAELRSHGKPLTSLESSTPLALFDLVGFSLQYELSYTNVLTMMELGGIPPLAADRGNDMPFVVGGGPCTFNPEPVAPFFDAFVLGDAEELVLELAAIIREWKSQGGVRSDLLKALSDLEGVYVPEFFRPRYDNQGRVEEIVPKFSGKPRVRKRFLPSLDLSTSTGCPLVPNSNIIHDRLSVELVRGCTRGCRFCQAGFTYRPVRERSPQQVLELVQRNLDSTGYDELSLLALSVGDYTDIQGLLKTLMNCYSKENVAVSLPSLRVDTLDESMIAEISRVRKTGFTLAPEAGSERLWRVINKGISESDLLNTVRTVYAANWPLIKLYFMLGLPTETAEDRDALVELSLKVWKEAARQKPARRLNVSVSTFVPKAHTPFQWVSQLTLAEMETHLAYLRRRLDKKGLQFKWHKPWQSVLEGVFSRGDRRLAQVLLRAQHLGCRFDGWSDQLRPEQWQRAFAETGIDPTFYGQRSRGPEEVLPWSHLDCGVSKDYLWDEYEKALAEAATPDCRSNGCGTCGVCDHKNVAMQLNQERLAFPPDQTCHPQETAQETHRYSLVFAKTGGARFLSHLEMMSVLQRAMRRAEFPLAYSKGYNPKPRISFAGALPLGLESRVEEMEVKLTQSLPGSEIRNRLNAELPSGLEVMEVSENQKNYGLICQNSVTYEAILSEASWPPEGIRRFQQKVLAPLQQRSKRGEVVIPLEDRLLELDVLDPGRIRLTLTQGQNGNIRIRDLLAHIFNLSEEQILQARIVKIDTKTMEG